MVVIMDNNVVYGLKFAPRYEHKFRKSISDTAPKRVCD